MITNAEYRQSEQVLLFTDETSNPRTVWKYDAASQSKLDEGSIYFHDMTGDFDKTGNLLWLFVSCSRHPRIGNARHPVSKKWPETSYPSVNLDIIAKTPFTPKDRTDWLDAFGRYGIVFRDQAILLYHVLRPMVAIHSGARGVNYFMDTFRDGFYLNVT